MSDAILQQIMNPGLASKVIGGYQLGTEIAKNRAEQALAQQKAKEAQLKALRDEQVHFMETSTQQITPALEMYQQDPITANKIYANAIRNVASMYPEQAKKLPTAITRDNYGALVGSAKATLMDLSTRRDILKQQAKPEAGAYKPGQMVEIKTTLGGTPKVVTAQYTPGAPDVGYGEGMVPKTESARFREGPMVSVGFGEKAEQKAKVDIAQKDFEAVTTQGDSSNRQLGALNQAKALLDDTTFVTGRLEPIKSELSAFAQSLGMDPTQYGIQNATKPQEFRAIMSGLVLDKATQMKGNLSDRDVRFLEGSVASLASTKDANKMLIDAGTAMAHMDTAKANFYRDAFGKSDISLTEIANKWRESPYNVPVVGKSPAGNPVFWDNYFDTMMKANQDNPKYYNPVTQQVDKEKLIKDISDRWKSQYAIK